METHALYELADQQNIEVLQYPMSKSGSMSLMLDNGNCYIGVDTSILDGGALERVHMGHELGHCVTGSFYNIYAARDVRQKHENKADKWAIRHLVPKEDLDSAVAAGYSEVWELAEYFDVTIPFIQKALCYYTYGHLNAELCFQGPVEEQTSNQ